MLLGLQKRTKSAEHPLGQLVGQRPFVPSSPFTRERIRVRGRVLSSSAANQRRPLFRPIGHLLPPISGEKGQ